MYCVFRFVQCIVTYGSTYVLCVRFVKCIANYGFAYVPYENIIRLVHCTVYFCTVHC